MKKIIIEDGLSLKQKRGIGQYTERLYELISDDFEVEMNRKCFLENIKNSILRRIAYFIWLNTIFCVKLLFQPKDTICLFTATLVPIIKIKNIKYISFIHDIRAKKCPELSNKIQNITANFTNWIAIRRADKIITVSETIKHEILNCYKLKNDCIDIIYNISSIKNIKDDEQEEIIKKYNITPKNYLFFIGGLDMNKNVGSTISAYNMISDKYPDLQLVIAGNKGNDNIINTDNKKIIYTGFISDEDVKVLYKNALIYIFPSLYEGFGIPILDAQYSGIPVICSDIPVFHEVAQNSALFCEPNAKGIMEALKKIMDNGNIRNELVINGRKNIERFSEEIVKKQILNCIN